VLRIHYDAVNPARRDIVRLGLHLRAQGDPPLSRDALAALRHLEPWYRDGASSALTSAGAELAMELNTFFRILVTDLALVYGGGESGLAYFLKTAVARLERDPNAEFSAEERQYIDQALAGAWRSAQQKYGPDASTWSGQAKAAVVRTRLGYGESLDGFPSLAPSYDLRLPELTVIDGGTIRSQAGQSYTQFVPMHDPDLAQTILPIGQSERPGAASRTSTWQLWTDGQLHPAPLSRAKVEALTVSRQSLLY